MKRSASISVDDSLWPLVIVQQVGTASLAEFEAHQEKRLELLRREQPHVVVVDVNASRGITLPTEHRQKQVEWMARHEELIRQRMLGMAYATDSTIFRLTMSLVFHIKSPACPYVITPSLELAVAWAASRLAEAGLHADAERIRYHFGLLHHPSHA